MEKKSESENGEGGKVRKSIIIIKMKLEISELNTKGKQQRRMRRQKTMLLRAYQEQALSQWFPSQ